VNIVVLYFEPQIAGDVASGRQRRAIRARYQIGSDLKKGAELQLYTSIHQTDLRKLGNAVCTRVRSVEIDANGVTLEGRRLYPGYAPFYTGGVDPDHYDSDFARAAGFGGFLEMTDSFSERYGLPFKGLLIEWTEPR
jgi:hypothetical protein